MSHNGRVKWFNNAKGYGFLHALKEEQSDIFIHYSAIQGEGYKTLREGDSVTFDLENGPKGLTAKNIVIELESDEKEEQAQ